MADNLEIRVEQLTDAIRGLYNKPSLTPAEINNALNTMLTRFENQSNVSSDKVIQIVINEVRKSAQEKQDAIQEQLRSFENLLKSASSNSANPRLEMEISKISSDLSSVYSKINNQELQMQKFNQTMEALRTTGTAAEMMKLSNDFAAFSRGFDNITDTLNKNFAEFLNQVQSYSSKEELSGILSALGEMRSKYDGLESYLRENALANTASKEDVGYLNEKLGVMTTFLSDLRTYLEKSDFENKSHLQTMITALDEKIAAFQRTGTIDDVRNDVRNLFNEFREISNYSKDEILNKFSEVIDIANQNYSNVSERFAKETTSLNENLGHLAGEVQKVCTAVSDSMDVRGEEIKLALQKLNEDFQRLSISVDSIYANTNLNDAVNTVVKSNNESLELTHDFVQSQIGKIEELIAQKEQTDKQNLVNAIELLKNELSQIASKVSSSDAASVSADKILESIESLKSSDQLNEISAVVENVSQNINRSIESLKDNFAKVSDSTNLDVLRQLNEAVPQISDKLEIFRHHVVTENSANLTELKQHFNEAIEAITFKVENITSNIKDDLNDINIAALDGVKLDLQNVSNHIMETVENINLNITQEFNDHKVNIDEVLSKINDYEEKFKDKLNSIESTFETLSQESTDRITDTLNLTNVQYQDTLNVIKDDILAGILGINKNNKTNFNLLDEKLNKVLEKGLSSSTSSISSLQSASAQELLAEIESKVERTNLQQIHNAKELMDEIQNLNSEITFKIENMSLTSPAPELPVSVIKGMDDKIQSLIDSKLDNEEILRVIKSHLDLRVREIIQKIAKIVSVFRPKQDENEKEALNAASANVKLNELLSNLEYLKDNIFNEIKDGFDKLDKKEDTIAEILKQLGEVLSNTIYLKNNIADEFKGTIEEKFEPLKNIEFSIEDTKCSFQNGIQGLFEKLNSIEISVASIEKSDVFNLLREKLEHLDNNSNDIKNNLENVNNRLDVLNASKEQLDVIESKINESHGKIYESTNSVISEISNNTALINSMHSELSNKVELTESLQNDVKDNIEAIKVHSQRVEDSLCSIENRLNEKSDALSVEFNNKIESVQGEIVEKLSEDTLKKFSDDIYNRIDKLPGDIKDKFLKEIEDKIDSIDVKFENTEVIKEGLDNVAQKLADNFNASFMAIETKLDKITENTDNPGNYTYTMQDVESDIAKLRLSIDKYSKNLGTDFKNLNVWLKNATARLEHLTQKVENTEKLNLEEIKTRLIKSEKGALAPEKAEEILNTVYKKYKIQEMRLEEMNEKLSLLIQKQSEGFDIKSFIDLFYDNTTQTKSLVSRVENLESKLNNISKNIERIISYIDE